MIPIASAVDQNLTKYAQEALEALDGVPLDDLNEWKPSADLADINTFYALAYHLVAAGEFWLLHACGGRTTNRDRPAEFVARGSIDDLRARYAKWLSDSREVLAGLTEDDLGREVGVADRPDRFILGERLLHTVAHSATHVGHLQIQRQLWDAEQKG
jgi:uncharacterized damage-inducible protein DinB